MGHFSLLSGLATLGRKERLRLWLLAVGGEDGRRRGSNNMTCAMKCGRWRVGGGEGGGRGKTGSETRVSARLETHRKLLLAPTGTTAAGAAAKTSSPLSSVHVIVITALLSLLVFFLFSSLATPPTPMCCYYSQSWRSDNMPFPTST